MKRSELKKVVKECVKEILFEEGVLSSLVAEVAFGITKAQGHLLESNKATPAPASAADDNTREQLVEQKRRGLLETKKKMLNAIGNTKMSKIFEGTEPLRSSGAPGEPTAQGPMAGRSPDDAGVDISDLFTAAGKKWNALK
jgi:hypothetical protein